MGFIKMVLEEIEKIFSDFKKWVWEDGVNSGGLIETYRVDAKVDETKKELIRAVKGMPYGDVKSVKRKTKKSKKSVVTGHVL